jgi:hypothetical protein
MAGVRKWARPAGRQECPLAIPYIDDLRLPWKGELLLLQYFWSSDGLPAAQEGSFSIGSLPFCYDTSLDNASHSLPFLLLLLVYLKTEIKLTPSSGNGI